MIKAQPSYEFEIFSIPNMETPLGINSNGTKIVGTNFGGQAVFWSDSTSTIAYGTGELWDISEDGRIFSELENASVALSEPAAIYCKCRIGCAVVVASENPITFALTPEVTPVITTGSVAL